MEDLLLLLLEAILELFGEAFFQWLLTFIGDLAVRGVVSFFEMDEFESPVLAVVIYFFLGAALGGFSLFVVPHSLFHRSRFHGASLLISPVLSGLGMSSLGSILRKRNAKTIQMETFACGFAFALGTALIRFIFAS